MHRKQEQRKNNEETSVNMENHNDGKNHGNPQAAKYTMREKITAMEAQGQRPLAPALFATRGGYNGGNYLFLSLSLSRSTSAHALYN